MKNRKFYLGLDIGTDSVGYAVTDEQYNLLRFHGSDAWGTHVFDEGSLSEDRRSHRTARRRLDRRQQRVALTRELFAKAISAVDEKFFIRLNESYLYREDCGDKYILFNDADYTDADYYKEYPTIHHLLCDLMNGDKPHDVRMVYIACAWLVAHRGHFLNNVNKENISEIRNFDSVYSRFLNFFTVNEYRAPWECRDSAVLADVLKKKMNVTAKNGKLIELLCDGKKPKKPTADTLEADFPFSLEGIIKLLAGGTYSLKDLFCKEEYDSLEVKSVSLGMDDEKLGVIASDIGDDYDLIEVLRAVYDWSVLSDVLNGEATVSAAKVKVYEQHKADLKLLKKLIRKYIPEKYDEVFRDIGKDNYPAYVYHTDEKELSKFKKKNKEDFLVWLNKIITGITPDEEDAAALEGVIQRIGLRTFLPKQKDTDNRVIPHQLYWYELHLILTNAAKYLPFLNEKDEKGLTVSEKLESIFLFRIPYFVGPLNDKNGQNAWLDRKPGKILPWNFEEMVDLDASEERFIARMTNTCTYLPDERVLPKDSLLYHKFTVLNEINNLKINNIAITVELKQRIYNEVFLQKKKVTRKYLISWLIQNGFLEKGGDELVTGIDEEIKSNLVPQIAFRRLFESGALTEEDAERIIERGSYAEEKLRLSTWISKEYPNLSDEDRNYITSLKIKDFGRLSRKFLSGLEGVDLSTGEVTTVISAMWNTNDNLMQIIADGDKYNFVGVLSDYRKDYYTEHPKKLDDRLSEMYLSNTVKRQVFRTLDIVRDVKKAFGTPAKIFVEMTRGGTEEQKGKRTKSRKDQILELYNKCKGEDVRLLKQQLEAMGEYADNKLQSEKLFLYYMQFGKSLYSGKPIELMQLGNNAYCDIDHIYPQAYVKDDSIINNKALVFSTENGKKSDVYPLSAEIRHSMKPFWDHLKDVGAMSEEKYKRLVRATPFTDEEKYSFINRQITETSQSTKAVASLLKDYFPDTEIVYSKARLTSEFRHEFDIWKSRTFNDLHHAVDAYLNIVCGNVYNMKFTKNFKLDRSYSIKTRTLFTHEVKSGDTVVWDGDAMLAKVKKTAVRNTAHFTKFSFFKKGGLFDQNPVPAAPGLVPLKKDLPTEKYGGYNKAGAMFYIPVRYKAGKKSDIIIMSVELLYGNKFLKDAAFANEYSRIRIKHITGKTVDEISFPMGMRPWKVNTVLSLDGFRVCIAGIGSGGRCLVAQPSMQFHADAFWCYYLKKLEVLAEKSKENSAFRYDADFDKVTPEKNLELYDLYIDKYKNSVYSKRVNAPLSVLEAGREKFAALDIISQTNALLNVHQTFGRVSGGCDLTLIGGAGKAAATVNFSSTVSNWKKTYSDVRLVDTTPSGLWEKQSDNILDLL